VNCRGKATHQIEPSAPLRRACSGQRCVEDVVSSSPRVFVPRSLRSIAYLVFDSHGLMDSLTMAARGVTCGRATAESSVPLRDPLSCAVCCRPAGATCMHVAASSRLPFAAAALSESGLVAYSGLFSHAHYPAASSLWVRGTRQCTSHSPRRARRLHALYSRVTDHRGGLSLPCAAVPHQARRWQPTTDPRAGVCMYECVIT